MIKISIIWLRSQLLGCIYLNYWLIISIIGLYISPLLVYDLNYWLIYFSIIVLYISQLLTYDLNYWLMFSKYGLIYISIIDLWSQLLIYIFQIWTYIYLNYWLISSKYGLIYGRKLIFDRIFWDSIPLKKIFIPMTAVHFIACAYIPSFRKTVFHDLLLSNNCISTSIRTSCQTIMWCYRWTTNDINSEIKFVFCNYRQRFGH